MLFNSYVFIGVFLPVTLLGFFALSKRPNGSRLAKAWLVFVSLFFYGWWNPVYIGLMVASILFNFAFGKLLWQSRTQPRRGRWLLIFSVAVNLALLGYYKYANFFVDVSNAFLGTQWHFEKLLLPLGISFFTFTQITFLVDSHRGAVCEGGLADYTLFVTFFPHLIAGPVIHHAEMMPQFARPATYRFKWDNLAVGITLFAIGLFKKVVIADGLSDHVSKVFGTAAAGHYLHCNDAWAGALSYTFQIYFDFSGYSDMALGLARMFGIVLPWNFNSPYKAVDLVDFWRRWHITLSRCLRDYVYIPLGGNRRGPVRRYVNLVATMLLGGLWHGAGWTFIAWGALHGVGLAFNHMIAGMVPSLRSASGPRPSVRWAGRVVTLLVVVVGWVFFRATDMHGAHLMLTSMAGLAPAVELGAGSLLKSNVWIFLAGMLAFVWFAPNAVELMREFEPAILIYQEQLPTPPAWLKWRPVGAWSWVVALLLVISVLSLTRAGEFLYYNF